MRKFIVDLFSNRFGIVLAAINLCYLASKWNVLLYHPSGKLFLCANLPAGISSFLSVEFTKIFWHRIPLATEAYLANIFLAFFIVLQWLFIAWIARTIAGKFRPKEL